MLYDFDRLIERRGSDSVKWQRYGNDILPMWVADMDFASPEPVTKALHERIAHGVFGYGTHETPLSAVLCERLAHLYHWQVTPEQILYLPGLVCGLNVICRAVGQPGDEVIVQSPVYPPFLAAPVHQKRILNPVKLALTQRGGTLYYEIDYAAFVSAITQRTRLFILCHPHNPVGRVFTCDELARLGEICIERDLIICSDEIHCDLLLDGTQHRPMASVAPEIAERCITLMAPSKTFNLAGLGISFAIVQNPALRQQVKAAAAGIVPQVNILGFVAALAAYRDGADWLKALLAYLTANRNLLVDYIQHQLPGIHTTCPQATYLAWLDCRKIPSINNPQHFFLRQAKVAFNDGATFGPGGEGFVRLNFGCQRALLMQGLERLKTALTRLNAGS
jgi:cystathionine beta-lyase